MDDMRRSHFYRSCGDDREPLVAARVWSNPPEGGFVKSRLLGDTLIKPLFYSCPWHYTHFIPDSKEKEMAGCKGWYGPFTCTSTYRMNSIHYVTSVLKQQMVFPTTILQTRCSIYIRVLRRFPGSVNTCSRRKSSWSELICWYWNNSTRVNFNLPGHSSITWRMRENGMWPIDSWSLWKSRMFFAHIKGIYKC